MPDSCLIYIGRLAVPLEYCGDPDPRTRMMGIVDVGLGGEFNISMHVEAIQCAQTDKDGITTTIAEDSGLQPMVEAYYELNGGEPPSLVELNDRLYLVLIYPFAA